MTKKFLALALGAFAMSASATYMEAPACADEPVNPDSTGFVFTDVHILPNTPVKDQNKSGTCWAFAGISQLESDILRRGGEEIDLSEMFIVRNNYKEKARKYIRMGGKINFAQGGGFADVINALDDYGIVPEEAYAGLNYGEPKHSHYEMAAALEAYLDAILKNPNKKLSTAWEAGFDGILDAYLGKIPETFTYKGKTYTPKEFAKALGLKGSDFTMLTSYTHHPFYQPFAIEIPDNWRWSESWNVPMDEFKQVLDAALDAGYTVGWAADVSEPTFKWREGVAVLPEERGEADMDGTELARWVKLSDSDREKEKNKVTGPRKERTITQEDRQKTFDNMETTDDHGMEIVGTATDQNGTRYYKVKNSWDTNQIYDGYFYVSEPYFLEKTIAISVHKDALPKEIAKKLK
ncbi:MAG: C1 family peptidase [Muribaculaceae bacterium]|nr:C1 family peptidase [Muribaculaceae bacterium]